MKQITLIHNITTDPDNKYGSEVIGFFEANGIGVHHVKTEAKNSPDVPKEAEETDLVLVLGGDGTFLRAAERFANKDVPLVGVNTGTLGFLTRIEANRLPEYLDHIIQNRYHLDKRIMLAVRWEDHLQQVKNKLALNDVLIKNANPGQLCTLKLYINDTLVALYDADGIVVSTPTGSTAYNLSAGGPIISPEIEAISITPICPHSFSSKAVVVPADKTIRVESHEKNREVFMALDGAEFGTLNPGESIEIIHSPTPLQVVEFDTPEDNFYLLLQKKLHWSMNPRFPAASQEK